MPDIKLPPVTDMDIAWAVEILNLPKDAFAPEKDGGARERILKSRYETLDISACPGSGKTTLLVAKLAILARNWPYRSKGICVLSHTNVAKNEIEQRLGGTEVGKTLLSYPNYIGTIHGFVNEYLALPWLRSLGYPIKAVDDDLVKNQRLGYLDGWKYPKLKGWLKNQREDIPTIVNSWIISSSKFDVSDKDNKHIFKNPGESSEQLTNLVKQVALRGYHRYDEMFTWAKDLIDVNPFAVTFIRDRFPMLFLDEVQDNSETQSAILNRIFIDGESPVFRLRFGDADQEIFDSVGKSNKAVTDSFPSKITSKVFDLPNSHRFGPDIAKLASPLSVGKVTLVGQGPKNKHTKSDCHAIFLIDDKTISRVLDAYGKYLLSVFKDDQQALNGMLFTAIGAVHRDKGDDHMPRHVVHYWSAYDPDIAKTDPRPSTFLQYVSAGHLIAEKVVSEGTGGESFAAVDRVALGILNKARDLSSSIDNKSRKRNHRFILDLLSENLSVIDIYLQIVIAFAVERTIPSNNDWDKVWKLNVKKVITALSGVSMDENDQFLSYSLGLVDQCKNPQPRRTNQYIVKDDERGVTIKLGSIHSVKGETHTATLVLETFELTHHLNKLSPNIQGVIKGKVDASLEKRLKLHYVAMTRPSHLLCLAMKKSTFEDNTGSIDIKKIEKLKAHGWGKVGVVNSNGDCEWI